MIAPERDIQALYVAAIESAEEVYVDALANDLEGLPSDEQWSDVRRNLARSLLLSELIGIEAVTRRAQRLGMKIQSDGQPDVQRFDKLADAIESGDGDDFVVGPFWEAVRAFEGRVPRLRSTVRRLATVAGQRAAGIVLDEKANALIQMSERSRAVAEVMRRSFWVSDVYQSTVVNLKSLLADVLRGVSVDSGDLPSFIDAAEMAGARNLGRARLETVYRNNLNTAYNEAQSEALADPDVQDVIPLAMIVEIEDRRTRPVHAEMNGYINTIQEIDRQGIRPPAGHNCRGGIRGVTGIEAERLGLLTNGRPDPNKILRYNGSRQALIDSGRYPDPGFRAA